MSLKIEKNKIKWYNISVSRKTEKHKGGKMKKRDFIKAYGKAGIYALIPIGVACIIAFLNWLLKFF